MKHGLSHSWLSFRCSPGGCMSPSLFCYSVGDLCSPRIFESWKQYYVWAKCMQGSLLVPCPIVFFVATVVSFATLLSCSMYMEYKSTPC